MLGVRVDYKFTYLPDPKKKFEYTFPLLCSTFYSDTAKTAQTNVFFLTTFEKNSGIFPYLATEFLSPLKC